VDVYLIRHTRPAVDPGICHGTLEVDLDADFPVEAERLCARLAPGDATLVTTHAGCCMRLAEHLAARFGATLRTDERLSELDFGAWEGRAWSEIPRVQTDVWARDVWNRSPPGGETYAALYGRVSAAWEGMLGTDTASTIVVGHAGPLRALITVVLELPAETFIRFHLDHGGIAKLSDHTGGWRLEYANR